MQNEFHSEWKLRDSIFHYICREFNSNPLIDLLITRLTQLGDFVFYILDPKSVTINTLITE